MRAQALGFWMCRVVTCCDNVAKGCWGGCPMKHSLKSTNSKQLPFPTIFCSRPQEARATLVQKSVFQSDVANPLCLNIAHPACAQFIKDEKASLMPFVSQDATTVGTTNTLRTLKFLSLPVAASPGMTHELPLRNPLGRQYL